MRLNRVRRPSDKSPLGDAYSEEADWLAVSEFPSRASAEGEPWS